MIPFVYHLLLFISFWGVAKTIKRYDIVDSIWGLSFVILCISTMLYENFPMNTRSILIVSMVGAWGIRLSLFLFIRFAEKDYMDARYQEMYDGWTGNKDLTALLKVYLFQAIVAYILAIPLIYSITNNDLDLFWLDFFGLGVWCLGFFLEWIADFQKYRFKKNNPDGVCNIGLWKYSRHPNYLGEIILWYGISLLMLSQIEWWLAIMTPVLTHLIIYFVSGVALLDKKYQKNNKYESYLKQTHPLLFKFGSKD